MKSCVSFCLLLTVGQTSYRLFVVDFQTGTKAKLAYSREMWFAPSLLIAKVRSGVTDAAGFANEGATTAWTTQRAVSDYWITCQVSTSTSPWTPTAVSVNERFRSTPTNHHLLRRERYTCNTGFEMRCDIMRFARFAFIGGPNQSISEPVRRLGWFSLAKCVLYPPW